MTITPLAISDVLLITPKRHGDARGWFAETWSQNSLAGTVADTTFVQDNQAYSSTKGILRGLHFQKAPNAQGKLIRSLRGTIFDVVVDLRQGSPTYGQSVHAVLTVHLATLTTCLGGIALYSVPTWSTSIAPLAMVVCVLLIIAVLESAPRQPKE